MPLPTPSLVKSNNLTFTVNSNYSPSHAVPPRCSATANKGSRRLPGCFWNCNLHDERLLSAAHTYTQSNNRHFRIMNQEAKEQIAPILGRIPSGVFIMIAGDGAQQETGLLASWVQQASFEPPQVTIAVNKSRYLVDWLKAGSPVTLNQVSKGDGILFKHFGKGFEPDADAFDGIETIAAENGLPLLTAAMASLEGTIVSQLEAGDHIIYLADITSATAHQDAANFDPFVHVRKNGFNY